MIDHPRTSCRRLVTPEDVAHGAADLAERAGVAQRLMQRRQQILRATCRLPKRSEPALDPLGVATGLEGVQALHLRALGIGVDPEDVLDLKLPLDVLVDAH